MRNVPVIPLVLLFVVGCSAPPADFNKKLERIMTLENSRCAPDSLYKFLRESHDALVVRTLRALGQLRDTMAVDTLIERLEDPRVPIVEETAFALGQIGFFSDSGTVQPQIENALLAAGSKTSNPLIHRAISEALGRTGSLRSVEWIGAELKQARADLNVAAAYAVARLAMRKFTSPTLNLDLMPLISSGDLSVRRACVYAATRVHYREHFPHLLPLLKDKDEQVRMDAARALGSMGFSKKDMIYPQLIDGLVESAFNDPDWRVRVNALNALSSFQFPLDDLKKIYFLIAFEGHRDKNTHVRVAAIRALPQSYAGDIKDIGAFLNEFTTKFIPASQPPENWEILAALAQLFGDRVLDHPQMVRVIERMSLSTDRYVRARTIDALASMKSTKTIPLIAKALADSFQLVRLNAADALGNFKTLNAREILQAAIRQTNDATFLAVAAQSASKILTDRKQLSQDLTEAFGRLSQPVDAEAQTTLFDVLGDLGIQNSDSLLRSHLNDGDPVIARSAAKNLEKVTGEKTDIIDVYREKPIDFDLFLRIKKEKPIAILQTDKGRVELEFITDDAPLTVINFILLAEKEYFDGSALHRVVPNFVVQGGDPSGSGWGGPGYSIRSEFNELTYNRGCVGMASAGPDTEGSQWFITHSATPHLDRRYTLFANVKSGMEVVDELQVGDQVKRLEIIWNRN